MTADEAIRVKEEINDTLDICGAVVVAEDHPSAVFTGFSQEPIFSVFIPLLHGVTVDILYVDKIKLSDLELLQGTWDTIQ